MVLLSVFPLILLRQVL
ncbi:hypothetical protein G6549_23225 [Bacillus sp. MM2020_1]|nr:hypothetical protein [Bacillus sp. MM2020_1]